MNRKALLAVCLILVLFGAGCAADQELATQVADQGDRLVALEGQFDEMNAAVGGLTMNIDQLVATETNHTSPFDVAIAQFVMDTAGFHEIEESLAAGDPIDPSFLGTVLRVEKVLTNTEWPEELSPGVEQFLVSLHEFQTALEADDAAEAAPLATAVHDEGHELSEMIDAWLGLEVQEHGDEG